MKMLKDVPMLSSFYSGRDGHRDREMIVMLTPRIPDTQKVAAPEPEVLVSKVEPAVKLDNPQVAPPRPVTAPPPIERPPVQPATPPVQPATSPVQSAALPVPAAPPVEVKPYSVQVGAFSNQVTANNLKRELEKRYPDVFIEALVSTRVIYRVRVGHFKGIQAARQVEAQLKAEGLETTIAVNESK
jgi:cell division protein FtsN